MKKIEIPTQCPCCGFTLELVKDQLFCRNSSCEAQLNKKLEHFCKALSIKGLGPKSIEKLELSDITELYYLELSDLSSAVGEKIAKKLLEEIDKSRQSDLASVLVAFSIPLVGETAAKKLTAVVSNIDEINSATCKEAGLGEKVTSNLLEWLETEFKDMREFLPFSFKSSSKPSNTTGKIVCITGKLQSYKTKAQATEALVAKGFQVVESVTKTTNYLVDEQNNGSSKRIKADEYRIPIITNLKTFLEEN